MKWAEIFSSDWGEKMQYRGYFVECVPVTEIPRECDNGEVVYCAGFEIRVFRDFDCTDLADKFYAAVGFELAENSLEEARQFAKDVIDLELKNK